MRRHHATPIIALLALTAIVACDRRSPEPVTLTVIADSMIRFVRDTSPDGNVSVNCQFHLNGQVVGPEGEQAIVRGGRVNYIWWEGGTPAANFEWNAESVSRFWLDSLISTGETRYSAAHGFGQAEPARLVRGSVVFDYASTNNDSVRTTNTWNFYCH
jgi:hypothetical protein